MNETAVYKKLIDDIEATNLHLLAVSKDYTSEAVDYLKNRARTLNYYKDEGLLPERAKKSNFSFVELVWVRIVFALRNIGINADLIKKLRSALFDSLDIKLLQESFKEKEIEIENLFKDLPKEDIKSIKAEFNNAIQKGALYSQILTSKLFTLLSYSIKEKAPVEIRLFTNGDVSFYTGEYQIELDENLEGTVIISRTYISISLTEIIGFYIGQDYIKPALKETFFSKDELLILEIIRKEKPKSINIDFTAENSIDLIKVRKGKHIDIQQRLSEIFLNSAYEEVTITTQKGKIVSCIKTKKIKPNNKDTG